VAQQIRKPSATEEVLVIFEPYALTKAIIQQLPFVIAFTLNGRGKLDLVAKIKESFISIITAVVINTFSVLQINGNS
jgi:hypothetical protein